jgi:hypothetical protein
MTLYAPNPVQKPPTTSDMVKEFARRLRSADPENFQLFVGAFDAYTTEATVAVTEATSDQVLNMQGRARQCRAVLRLLQECHIQRPTTKDTA